MIDITGDTIAKIWVIALILSIYGGLAWMWWKNKKDDQ